MASGTDSDVPQWKKDLIARLRNQNKHSSVSANMIIAEQQQLCISPSPPRTPPSVGRAGQQPSLTYQTSESVDSSSSTCASGGEKCKVVSKTCSPVKKMVQERIFDKKPTDFDVVSDTYTNGTKESDSDSSEDLHYGPGIVNKLKNKYLSLALRENAFRSRPSILRMRKATSLENMLDDDMSNGSVTGSNRLFLPRLNGSNDTAKNAPNRYRPAGRGIEMKRARSVEAISRTEHDLISNEVKPERKSMHEDMLINHKEGNEISHRKTVDNKISDIKNPVKTVSSGQRLNKPKRIAPLMSEREKPPADVVKQAKLIFERRPEQRTKAPLSTGEVAAKVDTYNNIIVKAKASKKPALKHKPVVTEKSREILKNLRPVKTESKNKKNESPKNLEINKPAKPLVKETVLSPIPDVSRIDFPYKPECKNGKKALSETPDLILTSSPLTLATPSGKKNSTEKFLLEEIKNNSFAQEKSPLNSPIKPCALSYDSAPDSPGNKIVSPTSLNNINKAAGTAVFNFSNSNINQSHLPVNKNVSTVLTPTSEPLNIETNCVNSEQKSKRHVRNGITSPVTSPRNDAKSLSATEIEKNLINTVKTFQQPKSSASVRNFEVSKVPKVKKPVVDPLSTSNTAVFNFTDRKDVPDYISNDLSRTPERPELPKPGEGGIILIPGATILDSYTDEDEEIMRSLEAPPSPCDVTFLNDNILIDGKSSLKSRRSKLRISFVDAGPEIYEYPSEISLLIDDSSTPPISSPLSNAITNISGSSLANYTPKSTEEFQPGVTRSASSTPNKPPSEALEQPSLDELDIPVIFSAGTNSDMLF